MKRGQFAEVTSEDVSMFRNILSKESKVLCSSDELDGYNTDWIGIAKGNQSRLSWIQDCFVFCGCIIMATIFYLHFRVTDVIN